MIQKYCGNCQHLTRSDNGWLVERDEKAYREFFNCTLEWTDHMKDKLGNLSCDENEPFFFQENTYPEDPTLGSGTITVVDWSEVYINKKFVPPDNCPYLLENLFENDNEDLP